MLQFPQGLRFGIACLLSLLLWVGGGLAPGENQTSAIAAPTDLAAREVQVSLGNEAGELKFFPNQLHFESGIRYKLLLNNPSPVKHYFTAKDFADAIWTQKIDAGQVEIKGAIHEVELRPGSSAAWVFVPIKPGTYALRCVIPGHAEAGMTGKISISS